MLSRYVQVGKEGGRLEPKDRAGAARAVGGVRERVSLLLLQKAVTKCSAVGDIQPGLANA
jgi:hypothetical protein